MKIAAIRACDFCKKNKLAIKDYLEQYISFDGTTDNDIDADDDIIVHMDTHLKELETLQKKADSAKKSLLKTILV